MRLSIADICVAIRLEGELHAWWGCMFGPVDFTPPAI